LKEAEEIVAKAKELTIEALETFKNRLDGQNPLNLSFGKKSPIEKERARKTKSLKQYGMALCQLQLAWIAKEACKDPSPYLN
jgi:hypothetical protein